MTSERRPAGVAGFVAHARATLSRFPLALAAGTAAAVGLMMAIDGPERDWHLRLMGTGLVALPAFVGLAFASERWRLAPVAARLLPAALLVAVMLLFAASLHWTDRQATLRFAELTAAAHLAAAVLPYLGERSLQGFWQYNRLLLQHLLVATFFVAVLWAGLSLALLAIDRLLGVDVPGDLYQHLLAVLAFVAHPWFVLARMPRDLRDLDHSREYPAGLRVFAQFVLIPLVGVYLAILTAYLGRVLVTGEWPRGWIGWLVSGVSVAGVLALLLVHPLREPVRWVGWYARWFFVALLPALGMLLAAIGARVSQYGITEPRFLLVVLAVAVLALSLYYGITGSRNIKLVPAVLCLVLLGATLGPWSAAAVSRRSQLARLDALLARNDLGRVGEARRGARPVPADDQREVAAVISYLEMAHGAETVVSALGIPADSAASWTADSTFRPRDAAVEGRALAWLGLERAYEPGRRGPSFGIGTIVPHVVDVAGFDRLVPVQLGPNAIVPLGVDSLVLRSGEDLGTVVIAGSAGTAALEVGRAVRAAVPEDRGPEWRTQPSPLTIDATVGATAMRLVVLEITGDESGAELRPTWMSGYVLIRLAGSAAVP